MTDDQINALGAQIARVAVRVDAQGNPVNPPAPPRTLTMDEMVALARIKAGTHVLVPRKPTAEMKDAGRRALAPWVVPALHPEEAWIAMIETYLAGKLSPEAAQAQDGASKAPAKTATRSAPAKAPSAANRFLWGREDDG